MDLLELIPNPAAACQDTDFLIGAGNKKKNKTAVTFSEFFSTVQNHKLALLIMFTPSNLTYSMP
jgi:hypothetical protein